MLSSTIKQFNLLVLRTLLLNNTINFSNQSLRKLSLAISKLDSHSEFLSAASILYLPLFSSLEAKLSKTASMKKLERLELILEMYLLQCLLSCLVQLKQEVQHLMDQIWGKLPPQPKKSSRSLNIHLKSMLLR